MQTIAPSDANYEKVRAAVNKRRMTRVDYDALSKQYNEAKVGSIILMQASRATKISNVIRVLSGRGLKRWVDVDVLRLNVAADGTVIPIERRPLVIEKLSDKEMK